MHVCVYHINCLRANQTFSEFYLIIRVTERPDEVRGGNAHTHTKLAQCGARTTKTLTSSSGQSHTRTAGCKVFCHLAGGQFVPHFRWPHVATTTTATAATTIDTD